MSDYIVRAMAADSQIRAFAITSRELVEQARQIHNTSPVATAALGRTLSAGAMMGASMKGEKDLLTIQIRGDGPLGGIVVTADSGANVKGYVHEPAVLLPANAKGKLDVAGQYGPAGRRFSHSAYALYGRESHRDIGVQAFRPSFRDGASGSGPVTGGTFGRAFGRSGSCCQ